MGSDLWDKGYEQVAQNADTLQVAFALIHSPLTGPQLWWPVAQRLRSFGHRVVVPNLVDAPGDPRPLWQQHVESAVATIEAQLPSSSEEYAAYALIAHSGAGPLLAAIGAQLSQRSLYLFVDAGLPARTPANRLDLLRVEGGEWIDKLEQHLLTGGTFPNWSAPDLHDTLPTKATRDLILETLRPRGSDYFHEQLPPTSDLTALRGAYLQWSPTYAVYAAEASAMGWPVTRQKNGHFHMLVASETVTKELLALTRLVIDGPLADTL